MKEGLLRSVTLGSWEPLTPVRMDLRDLHDDPSIYGK